MKSSIEQLYKISQKKSRKIIGLMSGTSMDGLDVALCNISGAGFETKVDILNFKTVPFTSQIKDEIRKIFAKKTIEFLDLALLNEYIGTLHGELVNQCLKEWNIANTEIDLVASHGQTVFHAPKILHGLDKMPNATLQIGDGDHLAIETGIITVSDFRQKHIAAGGEGAPLAVYGDAFIFSKIGENRIMLNMGGIANFTFLPKSGDSNKIFVTDTGTGNTLIDALTRYYFPEKAYDDNAEIARKGTVNQTLLNELKANDFFNKPFPKTTGPELFSIDYVKKAQSKSNTNHISPNDLLATLTRFSAETIAEAISLYLIDNERFELYLSGGGMHNPLLVLWLKELLPNVSFRKCDELGIDGDAKEAVLFAILANENLCGIDTLFENNPSFPSVSFGKISFPI